MPPAPMPGRPSPVRAPVAALPLPTPSMPCLHHVHADDAVAAVLRTASAAVAVRLASSLTTCHCSLPAPQPRCPRRLTCWRPSLLSPTCRRITSSGADAALRWSGRHRAGASGRSRRRSFPPPHQHQHLPACSGAQEHALLQAACTQCSRPGAPWPTALLARLAAPLRSWLPRNETDGMCQMTNAADLPEMFLLVSKARRFNSPMLLKCS